MSGRAHPVLCEISLIFSTFFHVVSSMFDPAFIGALWAICSRRYRQTSISNHGRLQYIYFCTQMLIPCSFDQNALGCRSRRSLREIFPSLYISSKFVDFPLFLIDYQCLNIRTYNTTMVHFIPYYIYYNIMFMFNGNLFVVRCVHTCDRPLSQLYMLT